MTWHDRKEPGLHDNALKRVAAQHVVVAETEEWSRVFTRSPGVGRGTTTTPSRGTRHPRASLALEHRAFARSLSPMPHEESRAPTHPKGRPVVTKIDLQSTIWEPPLPKHHQHQDHPPPHRSPPTRERVQPPPPPRNLLTGKPDGPPPRAATLTSK